MLDSLVRVSRRDVKGHFGSALTHLTADPSARARAMVGIVQSKLLDYPTFFRPPPAGAAPLPERYNDLAVAW